METMHEIYSPDRRKRVVFYKRLEDSFGFVEESWSEDEYEQGWFPNPWPNSICASLETAMREATGRIDWLEPEMLPKS
jgi:hypothetical protein